MRKLTGHAKENAKLIKKILSDKTLSNEEKEGKLIDYVQNGKFKGGIISKEETIEEFSKYMEENHLEGFESFELIFKMSNL